MLVDEFSSLREALPSFVSITWRVAFGFSVPIPTFPSVYTASVAVGVPSTNFPPPAHKSAVSTYDFVVRLLAAVGVAAVIVPELTTSQEFDILKI